ncbi:type II secretion system protein GspG [Halothiobacillus diazotrophicus]|uniref:Type II secretion system core protein G n=1 Tax=Halothiobacillus diazotrophicus TaxID=1860122 RepID=A0A191ZHQ7_9GAMM|nr:type II secretion system major pseudopilin GspG [Halothiobacillus diazotrophicus]ANJ67426.1 type II secretion system protein GspG [Halothiobacillus diazotrophicus]
MTHTLTNFLPTRLRASRGFTLIEVMVVVVILAILATIVVPKIMDRPDDARIAKAKQDVRAIESALQLYKLDNQVYPTTDQGLEALVKPPANAPHWRQGGYLDRLPMDPWNHPYQYLSPGQHGPFDLYSLGADGQPGGTGANADIGNWQEDGGAAGNHS